MSSRSIQMSKPVLYSVAAASSSSRPVASLPPPALANGAGRAVKHDQTTVLTGEPARVRTTSPQLAQGGFPVAASKRRSLPPVPLGTSTSSVASKAKQSKGAAQSSGPSAFHPAHQPAVAVQSSAGSSSSSSPPSSFPSSSSSPPLPRLSQTEEASRLFGLLVYQCEEYTIKELEKKGHNLVQHLGKRWQDRATVVQMALEQLVPIHKQAVALRQAQKLALAQAAQEQQLPPLQPPNPPATAVVSVSPLPPPPPPPPSQSPLDPEASEFTPKTPPWTVPTLELGAPDRHPDDWVEQLMRDEYESGVPMLSPWAKKELEALAAR